MKVEGEESRHARSFARREMNTLNGDFRAMRIWVSSGTLNVAFTLITRSSCSRLEPQVGCTSYRQGADETCISGTLGM